ncbi:MAG: cohesin domain-containing protein [Bacteroidota bacterium]
MRRFLSIFLLAALVPLSPAMAQGTLPIALSTPDLTIADGTELGDTFTVSAVVSEVTGLAISSFQLSFGYDPSLLQFVSYADNGQVMSTFGLVEVNEVPPGTINIAGIGSTMAGSGTLFTLTFEIIAFEGVSPLTMSFVDGLIDGSDLDGSDITITNGSVTIPPGSVVPVELTSFDALVDQGDVVLQWTTASEENNAGFEVQQQVNGSFEGVGFVDGNGTTFETSRYAFRLDNVAAGAHRFRLKQIDFDGSFEYHPVVEVTIDVPGTHLLSDAYPNPFNPATTFTLTLAQQQTVRISVFDTLGREVQRLHNGPLTANQAHRFFFDASALPSGTYLYRAIGETFDESRMMLLTK